MGSRRDEHETGNCQHLRDACLSRGICYNECLSAHAAAPEGRLHLFHVSPTHDTITPFQTKRVADYRESRLRRGISIFSLSLSLFSAAWARPFLPENIAQMLLWLARICDWSRFPQNLSRLVCWPLKVLARGEIFSVTLFTGRCRGRRNPRFGSEVAFCRRVSTLTRIVRQLAFSLGNCGQEITFHRARITFRDYKRKHARRYNDEKVKSSKNIREIRMSSLVCWKVGNGGEL